MSNNVKLLLKESIKNVGKVGDAARTKLAINLILQNNRAALAEGIAFALSEIDLGFIGPFDQRGVARGGIGKKR